MAQIKQILVTGGAGYIGSHTAKELRVQGYEPVVLDNLCHGHRWAVRWGPFVEGDLSNRGTLHNIFREYRFEAVIHFAAFAYVGESMHEPSEYFRNNFVNTLNLLDAMRQSGVRPIVFSSTCATYGIPEKVPIAENHSQNPVNPYGETKLMVERALGWYERAYGLAWTALRYFNAAGADAAGEIGEVHDPETHLIPRTIAAAYGDISSLEVFGTDYSTPDGTAVRDYIHVTDLATAHVKALERLRAGAASQAFNLGTGSGHSVREVIAAVERASGRAVPVTECGRRAGDPAMLVADASLAARELSWSAEHSSLDEIVGTACRWYANARALVQRGA